jgi:integrase
MTEAELIQLLDIARRRPLQDAQTVRRGKRKGEAYSKLHPATIARLKWIGRERALIYKMLVLTGLRKNELASLTVGQLDIAGPFPFVRLKPEDEKNRHGSELPIREGL